MFLTRSVRLLIRHIGTDRQSRRISGTVTLFNSFIWTNPPSLMLMLHRRLKTRYCSKIFSSL